MRKSENKAMKDNLITDMKSLFEQQEKDHYKPVTVGKFWNNNCIKYERKGGVNKTLSVEQNLNKIKP